MAITPLGNTTFVSQNVALPSTQVANELAKESFAAMANLAEFQAKEKSVERIDKAAPSDEVQDEVKDKREEESSKREQNEQDKEKKRAKPSDEEEQENSLHRLDISI